MNSCKEDGIGDLLKKLYTTDFTEKPIMLRNEINEKISEVSVADMSFFKIMNQSFSRIGDHYVLPMPFRDTAVKLPNNRWVAEKRLQSLKKKFQKDEKFHLDYKIFMNNLFEKGYARVCPTDAESNSSWYIPHHGVYHPNKPAKIRVLYDCSSKFQGRELNKEILSGPDLPNQIVGVLPRFREHDVAFMADIESMFYQVMVSEEHKYYLKFLWWKDGNSKNPLIDCQLNLHVFGATSSAGYSNYALKKTSTDYKDVYGFQASETLQRNFYVDDLLKSVKCEEKAIKLIEKIKLM